MRVARPTSNMAAARRFYVKGPGLQLLGGFEDHDSFADPDSYRVVLQNTASGI